MSHATRSTSSRTALVTGASSGIGASFAEVFASHGFDLVVTARRESRLRELADRLTHQYSRRVEVIACDLSAPDAATKLWQDVGERGMCIDALVNSAGFGTVGGYATPPWLVHHEALQLLVVATSELTYRALPGMLDRGYGWIVNVASTAGLAPAGAGTLYGAAKTFVVSFSQSLARELAGRGIKVVAVCPGLTRTEFHARPEMRATVNKMPSWLWMDPQDVAREGFDAVMAGRSLCIPGQINRLMVKSLRFVPMTLLRAGGRLALQRRKA